MPGCRRECIQTKQEAIPGSRQTLEKLHVHKVSFRSMFWAEHRYFPGHLCLHCRFRTMGILHVTFQSFQKPVVKKTSKGSYKKGKETGQCLDAVTPFHADVCSFWL